MKIIAFGDVHMDTGRISAIPAITTADLIIISGDLTNFGHKKDAAEIIDKVKTINPNILAMAGNLDHTDVDKFLSEQGFNLHGTGIVTNNVGIFGVGGSNPTPFNTPNEFPEQELESFILNGFEKIKETPLKIFVSHPPPLNTTADLISGGVHVGSSAVRKFIEQNQPDLCITGHIHEARATDTIGQTVIINPGMIKDGGYIEVTTDSDRVTAQLLTI